MDGWDDGLGAEPPKQLHLLPSALCILPLLAADGRLPKVWLPTVNPFWKCFFPRALPPFAGNLRPEEASTKVGFSSAIAGDWNGWEERGKFECLSRMAHFGGGAKFAHFFAARHSVAFLGASTCWKKNNQSNPNKRPLFPQFCAIRHKFWLTEFWRCQNTPGRTELFLTFLACLLTTFRVCSALPPLPNFWAFG